MPRKLVFLFSNVLVLSNCTSGPVHEADTLHRGFGSQASALSMIDTLWTLGAVFAPEGDCGVTGAIMNLNESVLTGLQRLSHFLVGTNPLVRHVGHVGHEVE